MSWTGIVDAAAVDAAAVVTIYPMIRNCYRKENNLPCCFENFRIDHIMNRLHLITWSVCHKIEAFKRDSKKSNTKKKKIINFYLETHDKTNRSLHFDTLYKLGSIKATVNKIIYLIHFSYSSLQKQHVPSNFQ